MGCCFNQFKNPSINPQLDNGGFGPKIARGQFGGALTETDLDQQIFPGLNKFRQKQRELLKRAAVYPNTNYSGVYPGEGGGRDEEGGRVVGSRMTVFWLLVGLVGMNYILKVFVRDWLNVINKRLWMVLMFLILLWYCRQMVEGLTTESELSVDDTYNWVVVYSFVCITFLYFISMIEGAEGCIICDERVKPSEFIRYPMRSLGYLRNPNIAIV